MRPLLILFVLIFTSHQANAADYYWINGSGDWSQISHWATTSGGSTLHSTVPSGTDDVYFDANSFSAVGQTVSATSNITFRDMDWTGATNNPSFTGNTLYNMNVYGSITLIPAMAFNVQFAKYYFGAGNHTLDWAGHDSKSTNWFKGTGTYSLNSDHLNSNAIYFESGTFNSNGYIITCSQFRTFGSLSTPIINLGSSTITASYSHATVSTFPAVAFLNPNANINAGNATFKLTGTAQFTCFHSLSTDTIGSIYITTNAIDNNFATRTLIDSILFDGVSQDAALKLVGRVNYISSNNNLLLEDSTNIGKCEIDRDFETQKSPSIDTLILNGTAASTFTLADGETLTIVDSVSFPAGNCKTAHTLTSSQTSNTATLHKAAGNVDIDYVSIYSITASGAATFTGIDVPIDNGNNLGWTISSLAPTNFYWVGGTGDWVDPTQWSLSSGGAAQNITGCLPGVLDSVFFDANSFNAAGQIVDVNDHAVCGYMDWTGVTNTPTFADSNSLSIYGSLIANTAMNWDYSGELVFRGNETHVINLHGQVLEDTARFNCAGTYNLLDSLNTEGRLLINGGIINTNDHKIRCWRFFVVGIDSTNLMFGKSRVEVGFSSDDIASRAVYTDHSNAVFDVDETTFVLDGTSTYTSFFTRRTRDFGNVYIHRSAQPFDIQFGSVDSLFCLSDTSHVLNQGVLTANYIYAENELTLSASAFIKKLHVRGNFNTGWHATIDTLIFDPRINSRRYTLASGRTLTIADSIHFPAPDCKKTYYLQSNLGGTQATILKNGGTVTTNYASLVSVAATGTAIYTSNNTLSDDGNNTGWTINNGTGTDYYWVGGTGDWSDPTQWSLSSGGAPQLVSGCLPSALDNVFFDANSFNAVGQIVTLDIEGECAVMNWTGATNNPLFEGDEILYINDSLELISAMTWDLQKKVDFLSQNAASINFAGQVLDHPIYFNGTGPFNLKDSIHSNKSISMLWGTINTNDHKLHFLRASINGNSPIIFNMGKTVFEFDWNDNNFNRRSLSITGSNVTINGAQSTFHGMGTFAYNNFYCSSAQTFGNFIFDRGGTHFDPGNSTIDSIFYLRNFSYMGIRSAPTINYIYSEHDLRISGNPHIKKAEVLNGFTTYNTATIDTLILSKTGGTASHNLSSNDTLIISDSIFVNANGCFSHNFQATNAGTAAKISMPAGKRFVTDFLSIKDLTAIGGGTFDAGKNSTDLGNNTGWSFANEQNTFKLKYKYYCLIPSMTKLVKTDPDDMPTKYWWRNTVTPFDTFNTNIDTIQVTTPGDYIYVMEYGGGCTIEDSVFVRDAMPAMGVHQTFYNNAKDKDWFNCSNWDNGLIPDSISNATIDVGDTVRITGDTACCYDLTVNGVFEHTGGVVMIFGDFANNGVIEQTGGKIVMAGSGLDSIKGTNMLTLDSLELNKNGYCHIARRTWINKNMDFVRGYATTDLVEDLRFLRFATSNGGNDSSFAIGPVYKFGSEAFVFPIGHGSKWARLGISDEQTTVYSPLFRAEYFKLLPTDTGSYIAPVTKVSSVEYWLLDKVSGNGSYKVKLFFEEANISGIQNSDSAIVARYNGSDWESKGNDSNYFLAGRGFVESEYVNSFSPFTFGTVFNNNTLPVNLIQFDAKKVSNNGLLTWTTAQEVNNSHFNILRSTNNINFVKIDEMVTSNGNANKVQNYSYLDPNIDGLKSNLIYYKLEQVDENGAAKSSETRFIELKKTKKLIIRPNPSNGIFKITTGGLNGNIEVFNAIGEIIYIKNIIANKSETILNLGELKTGTYVLKFTTLNEVTYNKITLLK